jgi:RNA polymerase sigma-70 factor, ECF subfamily
MSLRIVARNSVVTAGSLPDETRLIAAAQGGDDHASHQLYEYYRDRIYNLIYYSLREPQGVEDVLQIVFLKAFQALPLFRGESSFMTWIYRIALNECKNAKTRRRVWVSFLKIFQQSEERDPQPSPELLHEADRKARSLQAALLKLKPMHREVVLLKYQEELSYEEVASILGVSPGTVASRLNRALKILESSLRRK